MKLHEILEETSRRDFMKGLGAAACVAGTPGCATTEPNNNRMKKIKADYKIFVDECYHLGGKLSIDRPANKRRVQNAPPTVWEMQDAVCDYPGRERVRMYY